MLRRSWRSLQAKGQGGSLAVLSVLLEGGSSSDQLKTRAIRKSYKLNENVEISRLFQVSVPFFNYWAFRRLGESLHIWEPISRERELRKESKN